MRVAIHRFFMLLSKICILMAEKIIYKKSKLIKQGTPRSLYKLPSKKLMLLNLHGYIDTQIINRGVFESRSTEICNQLIKPGDVVIDVGANIGYYTIMFSELVGKKGHVYAFEPTKHFRTVLKENLDLNNTENITILDYGLSNKDMTADIDIGPSSATMHSPEGYDEVVSHEKITLKTFNDFVKVSNITQIDFIKIDVDGHEPYFFDGAWDALASYDVIILFEISHLHYLEAGVTAWDFYEKLISKGYNIFHENGLKKVMSRNEFLRSCADFSSSCNVVITKRQTV